MFQSCQRNQIILALVIGILLVQGCLIVPEPLDEHSSSIPDATSTKQVAANTTETPIATPTTAQPAVLQTPETSNLTLTPPPQTTPIAIEKQCLTQTDELSLAKGLVLVRFREEPRVLQVLGSEGLANPQFEEILPSQYSNPGLSPDGKWMKGFEPNQQEQNVDRPYLGAVKRIAGEEERFFSRPESERNYWLNSEQIAAMLKPKGDLFTWIIINPFTENEQTISMWLEGSRYDPDYSRGNVPSLDPKLELVAQSCSYADPCEGMESIIVKDISSGVERWRSDADDPQGYDSAAWSSDGEHLLLFSVEGARSFEIHERSGQLVHNVVFPQGYVGSVEVPFSWSPDGRFIVGYYRFDALKEESRYVSTFLYDVSNGSFVDLCLQLELESAYYWSHDSSRFAMKVANAENRNDHEIYVIDVLSRNSVTLSDAGNEYGLKGWAITE